MKKFLSLVLVLVSVKIYSQTVTICAGSSATLVAANTTTLITPSGTFNTTNGQYVVSPTITTNYTILSTSTPTSVVNTVVVNPMPLVSPTYTQATCTNTASGFNFHLTFNPSSPAPSYTVTWAPPPPPPTTTIANVPNCISSPTDYSCTGYISPGVYQASVTAAGGCQVVIPFTIQPAPAPALFTLTPAASVVSITCAQPNPTITANNPGLTYTWTSTTFTPVLDYSVALSYTNQGTVVVVGTNTNSGCNSSRTISVVVYTTIPVGSITPSVIAISCTNANAPNVTLTCTSPTVNFTHYVLPPTLSPWTSNLAQVFYQVGPPGTYSYCLTNDANGCVSCKNFTVTSTNTYPTYTLSSPDSFTVGCGTKSVATVAFANPQAGTTGAPLSYTFIPPGGNPNITGPFSGVSSISLTAPGQWTVICYETGSGCQTKATMPIIQNTVQPVLDTVIYTRGRTMNVAGKLCGVLTCDSTQVILNATSETGNVSYSWYYGSPSVTINSPSVLVTSTISATSLSVANVAYTLTLKDNGNFCTSSTNYTVYHNVAKPKIVITPANGGTNYLTCIKNTIVISNQSSSQILPFFNGTNRVVGDNWQGPSPQVPLSNSSSYSAGIVGTYTMTGRDIDNGCINTGTLDILDDRLAPSASLPSSFVLECGPPSNLTKTVGITLTSSVDVAFFTYSWTPPLPIPGSSPITPSYVPKSIGVFTCSVINSRNGCPANPTPTMLVTPASLLGSMDVSASSGFAPLEVNFFNNTTSAAGTATGIVAFWNFGNGTSSVTAAPGTTSTTAVLTKSATAVYKLPGTYTVKVIVDFANTCRDSITKTIVVDIPSSLDVPNVFTPNGDGVNDFYFLKTNSLTKISMSIYDRWGRIIFDVAESATGNISWDGKNPNGKDAPDGTYFYFLTATGKDGKEFTKKGTITLAR